MERDSRPTLAFWFDFASTYSYLAAMRIAPLAASAGLRLLWRPFLLGPLFAAQGWTTSPFNLYPAKGRYMWADMEREAGQLGLPFRRPHAFPQNSLLAARCARLGQEEPWGPTFVRGVFTAEFGDGRDIGDPATIGAVLAGLHLDADRILTEAAAEPNKLALRHQTEEARDLGLFGAPSFVTAGGTLFWGNDRLDRAIEVAAAERLAGTVRDR